MLAAPAWAAPLAAASPGAPLRPGRPATAPAGKYGKLPSWLPKSKVPVGRVVQASAAHPRLGIEGDTIVVHVGSAQVDVTTVGPQVPEEGKFPVPATSPCAFDVTFAKASAPIALRRTDFTVLDELGHLHLLRITAARRRTGARDDPARPDRDAGDARGAAHRQRHAALEPAAHPNPWPPGTSTSRSTDRSGNTDRSGTLAGQGTKETPSSEVRHWASAKLD